MAIAVNDIIEIIDEQTYDGQQCLNRYFYRVLSGTGTPMTPAEVGEQWWDVMSDPIRNCQNTSVLHTQIRVENRKGTLDYGQYVPAGGDNAGTRAPSANPMSANTAFNVTLLGATRLTKPGSKRLVGANEDNVGAFGELDGTILAVLNTYGQAATDSLELDSGTGTLTVTPVIWRPENSGAEERINNITDYIVAPVVSTQNTRKRGRGS